MRVCTRCQVPRDEREFNFLAPRKDGFRPKDKTCRPCRNEDARRRHREDPEAALRRRLRRKYNMSLEQYQEMLDRQGGACAICGRAGLVLDVDHDHSCCEGPHSCGGCVRGLLCRRCNLRVGMFESGEMEPIRAYLNEPQFEANEVR